LPRPLVIPDVMTLSTLADVRELLRHLPADHRERPTWRHVAAELDKAAAGADVVDIFVALWLALSIERVEYSFQ
jgi:hypothetical protein